MFRPRRVALLCTLALLAGVAAAFPAHAAARPSVVLAFWTTQPKDNFVFESEETYEPKDTFLRILESREELSFGFFSAIQGDYNQQQAFLDITQGSRQSNALYEPRDPVPLSVLPRGATATIDGWDAARERAKQVSVTIRPGLLNAQIPGGAGFAGVQGRDDDGAIAAADEAGRVAGFSLGPAATLAQRTRELQRSKRFVVVALPPGPDGRQTLDELIRTRETDELFMVAQLPPTPPKYGLAKAPVRYYKLPAIALTDGSPRGGVTSPTTRQSGLVSSIDLLPTVLDHLGIDVPQKARGEPIRVGKRISAARLEELRRRWSDIRGARQSSSLRGVIALSVIVILLLGTLKGLRPAIRPGLRITALSTMWWPTMVLVSATIAPEKRLTETAFIASTSVLLGVLTDRFVRWPRGPVVPAAVGLGVYTLDLAAGTDLLTRSVLGPSITFGARFYGISNELEPLLPIMALVGLAAVFSGRRRSTRLCVIYAVTGLLLGLIIGWGKLGADVGGVLTVGGGFTVATLMMLPGGITKRAVGLAMLVPFFAIGALVAVDLLLSGGGHLSRNLERTQGFDDLWELVSRRYELAFKVLKSGRTPAYFAGAALAVAFAFRNRGWLYAPLRDNSAWQAALVGGLACGVVGMLTNDSGPVLLTNSVMALAMATAYIQGSPDLESEHAPETPETAPPVGGPEPRSPDPVPA